jgi:hypothetical protein
MKFFRKAFGATAAGMALLALSGPASALTYQGAEFTGSATGSGTSWVLTLTMDFSTAAANNVFLGDDMESWSLTLPEAATVSMVSGFVPTGPIGWSVYGNAQADASGCGGGAVNAICADWMQKNILDGGGPTIDSGDVFTFVVGLTFANAVDDFDMWTGNFHLLSVREFNSGCPRGADSCWKKDGGLISQPLSVPEPGSLALLGLGLIGLGLSRRRSA